MGPDVRHFRKVFSHEVGILERLFDALADFLDPVLAGIVLQGATAIGSKFI